MIIIKELACISVHKTCKCYASFLVMLSSRQEALKRRDVGAARSAAKAAKAAFQDCEHSEGAAAAAALEGQADSMELVDRASVEGSQALAAATAALKSGQLEEARAQAQLARERFTTPGLGEAGERGLEAVEGLERALEEAEAKAGLVREGLEVLEIMLFSRFFGGSVKSRQH